MSKDRNPTQTTTPGPFQKYLFSSTCYVQIGECYKVFDKLRANKDDINNPDFTRELESIWETYVTHLSSRPISEHFEDAGEKTGGEWVGTESLIVEVTAMSKTYIHGFLETLNLPENHNISLDRFFSLWVFSCEAAYQELIGSDAYSVAIAELISTVSDLSDPATNS